LSADDSDDDDVVAAAVLCQQKKRIAVRETATKMLTEKYRIEE
jgi:hypothetical protein